MLLEHADEICPEASNVELFLASSKSRFSYSNFILKFYRVTPQAPTDTKGLFARFWEMVLLTTSNYQ